MFTATRNAECRQSSKYHKLAECKIGKCRAACKKEYGPKRFLFAECYFIFKPNDTCVCVYECS